MNVTIDSTQIVNNKADVYCSKCGSEKNYLSTGQQTYTSIDTYTEIYLICLDCGHKKLHSTFTTNNLSNGITKVYTVKNTF